MSALQQSFDYGQLPAERRGEVRDAAARIKEQLIRTLEGIVNVGHELLHTHDVLGDGAFGSWIESEFSMSRRTADRFMQIARRFGVDFAKLANFTPSVVYELAAPSTPDEVVEQAVEMREEGEKVTLDDIKTLKKQWADERRGLKSEIASLKAKKKGAKASEKDIGRQLSELMAELTTLRDANDTLAIELERAKSAAAVQLVSEPAPPADEYVTVEPPQPSQALVELQRWWRLANDNDRKRFMGFVAAWNSEQSEGEAA